MRTLLTFLFLLSLLLCALFLSRTKKIETIKPKPTSNSRPNSTNFNLVNFDYELKKQEIEKYRLGIPRFYDNKNRPFSNNYPKHPKPFIPDYRQPIDGIVPDNYPSTLESSNLMIPKMDMSNYFSDLLK
jgi:hypothetical protein